jgi:uncharacterized protein
MRTALRYTLLTAMLLSAVTAVALDVPFLSGRVTDNAEVLNDATRRALTERLKAHEDRTGDQIVVLTVPSLEGENIEEYAVRIFESWKLGKKGKDNGVLVIVAPKDRRMRIEVGYGLEGTLTDLAAGRIVRNVMTPRFKAGDYNGGIEAGVQAILDLLEKGKAPAGEGGEGAGGKTSSGLRIEAPDMSTTERILIGAFIFGIIGLFTVIGIVTPGAGWFLYFFLIPFWAMFPIMVVGTSGALTMLITYLVVFPIAKLMLRNSDWYKKAGADLRSKGRASIGGFTFMSGGFGGGGGWSSGGGGGFSGGGGSSGGGGASGSW